MSQHQSLTLPSSNSQQNFVRTIKIKVRGFVPYEESLASTLGEVLDVAADKRYRAYFEKMIKNVLVSAATARKLSKFKRARRVQVTLEIQDAPGYGKRY